MFLYNYFYMSLKEYFKFGNILIEGYMTLFYAP